LWDITSLRSVQVVGLCLYTQLAVCIGFSGKCTRPIFCSNFILRIRFIVSVTGSVSYLNENFVVFSLCGAVCGVPGVLTAVCIAPEPHNLIHPRHQRNPTTRYSVNRFGLANRFESIFPSLVVSGVTQPFMPGASRGRGGFWPNGLNGIFCNRNVFDLCVQS